MMNIIEFPITGIFTREDFDTSQEKSKQIAQDMVISAKSLQEYALTLAMAAGHAISFFETQDVEIDQIEALKAIAHGKGLKHD